MSYLKYICFLLLIGITCTSCEEVIELDLNTTAPQLVIEATLDAGTQLATVVLTQTNDFYNTNAPEAISGAIITLKSESNTSYTLQESTTGVYSIENVVANPGELFTLSVETSIQQYEATAVVPPVVPLNGVEVLENSGSPFGGEEGPSFTLVAQWDDPAGIENYYRIRTYVDEVPQVDIYTLTTDEFVGDGEDQEIPVRDQFEGDATVLVELMSTDEAYYDYFFQVATVVGDGFNSTTPFNPKGNFTNDALGYFGIYSASTLEVEL